MNYSTTRKHFCLEFWCFFFSFVLFLGYGANYKQSYISKPENHKPSLKT